MSDEYDPATPDLWPLLGRGSTVDETPWTRNHYTYFAEAFEGIASRADAALDRMLRPWKYPQPPRLPEIELFPHLTRWENRLKRWRKRVADIVYVARHGLPEREDYDW